MKFLLDYVDKDSNFNLDEPKVKIYEVAEELFENDTGYKYYQVELHSLADLIKLQEKVGFELLIGDIFEYEKEKLKITEKYGIEKKITVYNNYLE